MKKKNGFTLIELLAIIVILAIIAVITVPIILNIIDDAKKGSIKDSAYGYKDAINNYYISKLQTKEMNKLDGEYIILEQGQLLLDDKVYDIPFTGTSPNGGYLNYKKNKIIDGCLTIEEYKVTLENDEIKTVEKGQCEQQTITACNNEYFTSSPEEWFEFDTLTGEITGFSEQWDGTKDITIPCKINEINVVSIGDNAFKEKEIESIVINDNIKTIGEKAFSDSKLKKIKLGKNIETIKSSAFSGNQLTNIIIPNSVTTLADGVFYNNILEKVKIGTGVSVIAQGLFSSNPTLETITIPNNITRIESGSFTNTNLKELTIPGNVEYIGGGAFSSIPLEKLILEEGVKTIDGGAFSGTKITELKIPNSVEYISGGAFYAPIEKLVIGDGIKVLNSGIFQSTNISELTLGNNVETIGSGLFSGSKIKKLTIPDSVKTINAGAFSGAPIEELTLGENVKTIGSGAFGGVKITELVIPDSVETLDIGAFGGVSLKKITIGQNVTSMNGAFTANENLKNIYNNTGKAFDWLVVLGESSSQYNFKYGTVVTNYGNVIVSKPGETVPEIGTEICLTNTECFNVINNYLDSNENYNTVLLSKYNLNVGLNKSSDFEENLQNTAGQTCAVKYSDRNDWKAATSSDWDNHPAYAYMSGEPGTTYYGIGYYVNQYVSKLKSLGVTNISGRLVKYEDLINLGCRRWNSCPTDKDWIYRTSFWTGSVSAYTGASGEGASHAERTMIWSLLNTNNFTSVSYSTNYMAGVRPVIEIPTRYLNNYE